MYIMVESSGPQLVGRWIPIYGSTWGFWHNLSDVENYWSALAQILLGPKILIFDTRVVVSNEINIVATFAIIDHWFLSLVEMLNGLERKHL